MMRRCPDTWQTVANAFATLRRPGSAVGSRRRALVVVAGLTLLPLFGLIAFHVPAHAQTSAPSPLRYVAPEVSKAESFGARGTGNSITGPIRPGDKAAPLYLNADELEYDTKNNRVIARGNVEIYYNENALTADQVVYDQSANTLTAFGNVRLKQPDGAIVSSDRIVTTTDFAEAFVQSMSVVGKDDTRIVARRAVRRDGNVTTFEQGKFTPCRNDPGKPPLWCIAAQRVVHDKQAATITYQDAQFELFGVPVLYMPYFQHADPSVKNKSGFLIPEISSDSRLGFITEVPYHFALAPNYDFLFHPMYTAKYGVLWKGDWRHKLNLGGGVTGEYNAKLAGIDQNSSQSVSSDLHERWRGSLESNGRFSLSSWWSAGWNVTVESDRAFRSFYKLDNVLQKDRVSSAYLTGMSERNYLALNYYHTGGLVLNDDINTLPPGTSPFVNPSQAATSQAPVLDYEYYLGSPIVGGEMKLAANAISYYQDLNFTDGNGVARRANTKLNRATAAVSWRRKLIDGIGQTFTPFFALRGDVITTEDSVDPTTRLVVDEQNVARGVATAGINYAYPFVASTQNATHVVEPIAQIVARQNSVEQSRLPNIDARSAVFDDANLFEEKTTGYDRIDTGIRANYGMQYTYQAHSGGSARVLVGQSYHMSGTNIFSSPGVDSDGKFLFSPLSGLERNSSDIVAGLYLSPIPAFRAMAQLRVDDQTLEMRRADVNATASWGPAVVSANYAYTAASPLLNLLHDQEEIQGLLGLRVTDRWSVYGFTRFSLNENRTIQDVLQVRYADECFVLTASYIEDHIIDPSRNLEPNRTVMFRFELKHLGEFRYRTTTLDNVLSANQIVPR